MATIIYSVKVSVQREIESSWISYMRKHVGDVINTGCFTDYNIRRVVNSDTEFSTYYIEYHARNQRDLQYYFDNFASKLQEEHKSKFEGKFIAERVIMEDHFDKWFEFKGLQLVF